MKSREVKAVWKSGTKITLVDQGDTQYTIAGVSYFAGGLAFYYVEELPGALFLPTSVVRAEVKARLVWESMNLMVYDTFNKGIVYNLRTAYVCPLCAALVTDVGSHAKAHEV